MLFACTHIKENFERKCDDGFQCKVTRNTVDALLDSSVKWIQGKIEIDSEKGGFLQISFLVTGHKKTTEWFINIYYLAKLLNSIQTILSYIPCSF
jgi:hypothetical protein